MTGGLHVRDRPGEGLRVLLASAWLIASACCSALADTPMIAPSSLPRIGTVDPRFQSYNIEMIEVTGGRFWKPYRSAPSALAQPPQPGSGAASNLYQYRPPIDLADARLRKLAAALAPAYMRVSGTWANSTYFRRSGQPAADTAGRFQRRPDPPAMARRRRLFASGGRGNRDLIRRKPGRPRRRRRLEAGSGRTPSRL